MKQAVYRIKSAGYCIYSQRFWQLTILYTIGMIFSSFFGYVYRTFGENNVKGEHPPISDKLLTWATLYSGGLVHGIARILFGLCLDVWSFQVLYGIVMSI